MVCYLQDYGQPNFLIRSIVKLFVAQFYSVAIVVIIGQAAQSRGRAREVVTSPAGSRTCEVMGFRANKKWLSFKSFKYVGVAVHSVLLFGASATRTPTRATPSCSSELPNPRSRCARSAENSGLNQDS